MFYSYNLSLLYSLLDFFISIFIQRMCKGGKSHHTWHAHNFRRAEFAILCSGEKSKKKGVS